MANEQNIASLPHPGHPSREWPFRRSVAKRYGAAVLAIVIAFLMRYVVYGDFNSRMFTFFVPAALFAAWYGGLGPGMLATILGLVIGAYYLPPRDALWALNNRDLIAIGAYTVSTMLCVVLCENLHHYIRRLEHALERERHHHAAAGTSELFQAALLAPYVASHRGWPYSRSFAVRYGAAVGLVITAFALRYWLFGTQDHRFPFIFFVPAAMIATWYGGMPAGLLATAAGLMLGDYFFLSEHAAMGPVREVERLAIGLYAVTTTLCVMLFENLHNRIRRLEHALDHALHHHKPHHATAADSAFSY